MTRISKFALTLLATIVSAATYAHAQFSVIYSFGASGGVDAANSLGAIAQGEDGSLYSTAQIGGANDWGAVWKVTTAGKEKFIYSFCSLTNCTDGDTPATGLTLRPNGHFLGTTGLSDGFDGPETIFDVSQNRESQHTVYLYERHEWSFPGDESDLGTGWSVLWSRFGWWVQWLRDGLQAEHSVYRDTHFR